MALFPGSAPLPGTQLSDWAGMLGGAGSVGAHTWAHRWGDPFLASFAGSTAMLDGNAPADWTAQGMRDTPESLFTLARQAGWDYSEAVTPDGPTPERVLAQGGSSFCQSIPVPLRYLLAPCVGERIGQEAAPAVAPYAWLIGLVLALILLVLIFK